MLVKCEDMADFFYIVAESVRHGLTFTADASTLTVTYTGGH